MANLYPGLNPLAHHSPGSSDFIRHPSQAKPGVHVLPDKLYVLTMLENPLRYRARYRNYWRFQDHMEQGGAILYTAEIALGARRFEVTEAGDPRHLQLRTSCEFWHKENALNLLAERLPPECRYIAVFDADIQFARPDWAQEILHLLQHFDVIQPFSDAQDLGPDDEPLPGHLSKSFLYRWCEQGIPPHDPAFLGNTKLKWTVNGAISKERRVRSLVTDQRQLRPYLAGAEGWHPGLAWCYRRSAWDHLGGMMDWLPTGSGDWHMANALIGNLTGAVDSRHSPGYLRNCRIWEERAAGVRDNPNGGLGYMPGLLLHSYHGSKGNRQYAHRHKFVINVGFDPDYDLKRDSQGLWQLTGRNLKLRDGLRMYARMRNEDSR